MLRGPAAGHARLRRRRREDKYAAYLGRLLNDLIRPQQQRRRDGEAEGLRGLEVDDQFKLGRLLDRQIARIGGDYFSSVSR